MLSEHVISAGKLLKFLTEYKDKEILSNEWRGEWLKEFKETETGLNVPFLTILRRRYVSGYF